MARRLLPLHPRRRRKILPEVTADWSDHVLILGFGSGGMWVTKPLAAAGQKVVVVDRDPTVAALLARQGIDLAFLFS